MQKNDDKVGNKNKKGKGKKRAREKDGNRFPKKAQILALGMCEKQTSCLITSD